MFSDTRRENELVYNIFNSDTQLSPVMTGIGKLWPAGQIRPTTRFCTAGELRMVFTFLHGSKKSKEHFVK